MHVGIAQPYSFTAITVETALLLSTKINHRRQLIVAHAFFAQPALMFYLSIKIQQPSIYQNIQIKYILMPILLLDKQGVGNNCIDH